MIHRLLLGYCLLVIASNDLALEIGYQKVAAQEAMINTAETRGLLR